MAFWSKKRAANGKDIVVPPPDEIPIDDPPSVAISEATPDTVNLDNNRPSVDQQAKQALGADELQKRAADSKRRMALFGSIVIIFMRSPQFRALSLAELETLIVPAFINNQFLVMETQSKENGLVAPVGVALWALVSAEVDQRLSTNLDQPIKLSQNEWRSGNIAWLVAVAGDARIISPVLQKVRETVLKGSPLKLRAKDKDGREAVRTLSS
jgi:hemolysin-activating ACP:hemolysin acyltransferase